MKLRTVALLALTALLLSALASCAYSNLTEISEQQSFDEAFETVTANTKTESEGANYYSQGTGKENTDDVEFERKIIKTVNISGETKSFDDAIDLVDKNTDLYGGYIEKSGETGRSYSTGGYYTSRCATYRIRIPAENLDAFLAQLGDTINIVDNQSTVDDVSSKYYDIVSRLETLEAERTALTNMYASADTVEYMLQIQKRLYDVIEEIESYKTTLKYYDNQVAYSTVNLLIEEVIEYTEKVPEPATFGERISRAFRESWKGFAEACKNFAVGFVYALPTLLVLAVLGGGVSLIVYLSMRKSIRKKKLEREDNEKK
jgi:hypothetical protein